MPLPFENPDAADSPDMVDTFPVSAAPGPAQTIGPIPVSSQPDANAALTLTPGTFDSQNVFTPGDMVYGPYLAAATLAGGQYGLTVTTTDPVPAGPVSIQPGDWTGGAFSPLGAAQVGTLGASSAAADVAWTASLVPSNLVEGSDGWLDVRVAGQSNPPDAPSVDPSALSVDPSALSVDPSALSIEMRVQSGLTLPASSWLTAQWLPAAGAAYARLYLSAEDETTLPAGYYRVLVRLGGRIVLRCPGLLRVRRGL